MYLNIFEHQRSQDECFEIFSGLCITGFSSQLVLSANIIHHHKLNLQIEFSAAQHYAVALQCCMLRAAVPSDDEVTVIYRAKVAIKSGGGATNHGKVSTEDTLT